MAGTFNCLALHKEGLFVAGEDGVLHVLEISGNKVKVKLSETIGSPVSSLAFNATHHKLAIGGPKVFILLASSFMFQTWDENEI